MAADRIIIGDSFTIAGVRGYTPNINRRWWQLWKPRRITLPYLARFQVESVSSSTMSLGDA